MALQRLYLHISQWPVKKDVQADLDNYKRHNVQLRNEHKVLLEKHETLQIEHKQISERLTTAQSRLYEQSEKPTGNFFALHHEALDTIGALKASTTTDDEPSSYAERYGISAIDPDVPLSDCPKYKDNYNRTKLENWENFGNWLMGIKMKLAYFGGLHRLHPNCEEIFGVDALVDARCRRIMIDSIKKELVNTVYKNHYVKRPSEFFNYICITNNTGSHGRFCDAMKRLTSSMATGSTEKSMEQLKEIRQGLLDVGEHIPDKYLICALLYSLSDEYQLLRSAIFAMDTDKLDINEVYRLTLKYEGDHQRGRLHYLLPKQILLPTLSTFNSALLL
ncbi:hypothetical protein SARC_03397 [Sphaeroforma arctica JP610]|uniref:Uncharacterized protein n=1 Tax=Sphaeroforma arctica JP610 TaxID=667725 RepID=A0A0L0G5S5_9EUKA|nr:hypothetical protein SARC_03397 [Sphaeroforma arctica JP610]KNC84380.1 hypothetical protein SARC_03397 [Sphaeroforma arctica JP610]|eukprot:XP_014158282.1 hypothetical protein SARC_03397 [Sphaeroforma arctica JP610]